MPGRGGLGQTHRPGWPVAGDADWTSGLQDLTTALFPDARRAAPERATSAVAGFPLRAIWITVDDSNRTRSRAALLARVLVDIVD